MLAFDTNGHLQPYQAIENDITTFEATFVTNFADSLSRKVLFQSYLQFIGELKELLGGSFYQWINGSFVTQKKNPADIDVVTFLNYSLIEAKKKEMVYFRNLRHDKQRRLDVYFVSVYPETHKKFHLFRDDSQSWNFLFSADKNFRSKGYIQLNF